MKPLILCTILMVVTACATEESKPRAVRAAMTAEAPRPATGSTVPSSHAVAPPPTEPATASNTPQSSTSPTVPFFDINNFDKQLSASCRRGADTIVVTFEAPSSVNAIPERLNKWFSAVEKYDGIVQFQPDPDYAAVVPRGGCQAQIRSLLVPSQCCTRSSPTKYSMAQSRVTTPRYTTSRALA